MKAAATSWLVGERGAAIDNLEWVVGALLVGGVVLLLVRGERRARPAAGRGRRRRGGADGPCGAPRRGLPQQPQHDPGARHRARHPRARALPSSRFGAALGRAGVRGAARRRRSARLPIPRTRARTGAVRRARCGRAGGRRRAAVQRDAAALVRSPACARARRRPTPRARRRRARSRARPARAGRPRHAARPPASSPPGARSADRLLIARYRAANPQPVSRAQVDAWARERLGPARGGAGSVLLVR